MKLGFHYHTPAIEKDGKILTSGIIGRFLDSLAGEVDELICFMHTPLESEHFLMDYALKSANIKFASLGIHASVPHRLLHAKQIITSVDEYLSEVDCLLIRCPTPLLPAFSQYAPKVNKAFLIVGDYVKSARDLNQPFIKKILIRIWAFINKRQQNKAIKNAIVFVNNGLIYKELQPVAHNLHLIRTTTLTDSDFFERDDTCTNSNGITLLYTGRLDLSKGLEDMIQALRRLRAQQINAKLQIVGWEERNETKVTSYLKTLADKLGIGSHVEFHGKQKVGEELNKFYRQADIYVIGSRVNEGFPRTIWEAFANSLPVVASAVESIPMFLEDGKHAALIKPGSVEEMTNALKKIISDPLFRKKIIRNGYDMAKVTTLEIQSKNLVDTIHMYLKGRISSDSKPYTHGNTRLRKSSICW